MATNTYVALDKVTVGTAATTVTFTGISQSYTDLRIVINGGIDTADNNTFLRVGNGSIDSGSNYSDTFIDSRGTSAPGSSRHTNATRIQLDYYGSMSTTNSTLTVDLMNYSNTTTYKTLLSRFGNTTSTSYSGTGVLAGLWRSTNAINTIQFSLDSTAKFNAGTTFSLYGIAAEGITAKATGGVITSDSNYWYHTFLASGTFTPTQSITADALVVAGGGGGGADMAGGGGAGGLLALTSQALSATAYTVTVGAGGAGSPGSSQLGSNGANSQFGGLTAAVGGGRSGNYASTTGASGGSGGGAGRGSGTTGGAGTSGQGYAGGNGSGVNYDGETGGGGGAGGAGGNGNGSGSGDGGVGSSTYSSWGLATGAGQNVSGTYYLAGGGGGGWQQTGTVTGTGGYGGGGNGAAAGVASTAGTANTGGGGGGGAGGGSLGRAGGSGIVVIRYAKV